MHNSLHERIHLTRRKNNLDLMADKVKQMQQRKTAAAQAKRPSFSDIQKQAAMIQKGIPIPIVERKIVSNARRRNEGPVQMRQAYIPQDPIVRHRNPEAVKTNYIRPTIRAIMPPSWFTNNNSVDVSIIVPLFKSSEVIANQIRNWDLSEEDGLTKEVIYVNDGCPEESFQAVLSSWELLKQHWHMSLQPTTSFKNIGRIVGLSHNSGFATACNFGAQVAKGNYLIFLNADTIVTKNWVKPMIDLISDKVGMVGNLQLQYNGNIDSAGSEWSNEHQTFLHIGRDTYQGKRLSKPINIEKMPEDLTIPSEREMVTGCCFAMRKTLFDEIGGFDVGYRTAYWEDSDLNMEVRSRGYKVYYQPESIIYHKSGHSKAGFHPFMSDNAQRFYSKWVENGKLNEIQSYFGK